MVGLAWSNDPESYAVPDRSKVMTQTKRRYPGLQVEGLAWV
jgi:hypothetical protein